MYYINVVDENGKTLNIFKSKSEINLDKFTTCFTEEKSLLKKLDLDTESYKIKVLNKEREIGFSNYKYRNFVNNYENNKNYFIEKIFDSITSDNGYRLHDYFLNELALISNSKKSVYEENQLNNLKAILRLFDLDTSKNNVSDTDYDIIMNNRKLLTTRIIGYLNTMGKSNYNRYKELYTFLLDTGFKEDNLNYSNESYIGIVSELDKMRKLVDSSISKDRKMFSDESLPIIKENINEEEIIDSLLLKEKYDDEDEYNNDLEMYMDFFDFDEERKFNYKHKGMVKGKNIG